MYPQRYLLQQNPVLIQRQFDRDSSMVGVRLASVLLFALPTMGQVALWGQCEYTIFLPQINFFLLIRKLAGFADKFLRRRYWLDWWHSLFLWGLL